ncbi:MAG: CDP-alcohol phosphatidyltransferase family protein [Firmicutes bacterium]|nr:CDP-alcohol phosphatidyltransferase family protein [Bacillota bacterium]
MKEFIKKYWDNFKTEGKKNFQDLKSIKTAYKQVPNILTISRLLATIPINILYFTGNFAAALITCGVAALTDLVDGPFARKFNCSSKFGADLDAICDKVFILGMALPIIIQNPFMLLNLGLEVGIIGTNVKAVKNKQAVKSEMIGKIKTVILSTTVVASYLLPILNVNLGLLTSLLITTPALAFQIATLGTYMKINQENKEIILEESVEETKEVIAIEEHKEPVKQLEKTFTQPASIEELRKEREKLLQVQDEKGHQKTKTDLK